MDFSNKTTTIETLPRIEDIKFNPLANKYLHVMRIKTIITSLILLTAISIFHFSQEILELNEYLYIIAGILGLAIINLLYAKISFKHRAYSLRERDITYKRGYIFRSITTVPFNRIQHTEIKEGALSRLFSLQTVKFYTAGGATSDLQISGLNKEDANNIKEFVNTKIESYEK